MQKFFTTRIAIITSLFSFPGLAFALNDVDAKAGITKFSQVIDTLNTTVVKSLATMFLSLGLLAFFYGVFMLVWGMKEGNETEITNGKKFLGWGLVALFVMFSVYGIIKMSQGILFGNSTDVTKISIPVIDFGGSSGGAGTPANAPGGGPAAPDSPAGTPANSPGGGPAGTGNTARTPATANTSSDCTGKSIGTYCKISGRLGTCDRNEETGTFGCYVTPGATAPGSSSAGAAGTTAPTSCDSLLNGAQCTTVNGTLGTCQDDPNLGRGCR